MQTIDIEQRQEIYTVSQLNNEVKFLLEDTYPHIWVEGEISNFAAPGSGHWYFSLKDTSAQVKCCLFKGNQRKLGFVAKDGMHVLIRARVSLYENRGDYQLIADFMEERGEGKLRRAYEALKKKLEQAGLFDPAHKKPLPLFPKSIGIITSATGAAVRDILHVLKRRYACAPIIIYPTLVQGSTAAPTIANAIEIANRRNECDILILARGGGSLEDLWPFNEEVVAHAIFKSTIPIISGVGHEVDFTIADFVADKRAPTPSAAAEIITPDGAELLQLFNRHQSHIAKQIHSKLNALKQHLTWTQKHLAQQHPKRKLIEKAQRLDFCELTLVQLQTRLINKLQTQVKDLDNKLHRQIPTHRINAMEHKINIYQQKLLSSVTAKLNKQKISLANVAAKLDALSPLATLTRGYAIAADQNHHVLRDANEVQVGDTVNIRLLKGSLDCKVEKIII